jgi:hypothetical protein
MGAAGGGDVPVLRAVAGGAANEYRFEKPDDVPAGPIRLALANDGRELACRETQLEPSAVSTSEVEPFAVSSPERAMAPILLHLHRRSRDSCRC